MRDCTSWSPPDAREIVGITDNDPTTLYIYPEAADIDAVARAVAVWPVLKCILSEGDRRSEILANRKA